MSSKPNHPYHLVNPSPWPLLASIVAGLMTGGAVLYMHTGIYWLMLIGFAGVVLSMCVWWKDVIHEAVVEKAPSAVAKVGLRYGMLLFIASEVMFFFAFFWAYFNSSINPIGGSWPPEGIQTFNPFELPLMMTLVLLLSGTTVTWAHEAMRENQMKDATLALTLTVGLGVFFTIIQVYEYSHAHFALSDGIFPSTFYIATGFHGLHVLIGTIFLAVCLFRNRARHFKPKDHFGFEAAAWYWHFVDVVWLFLFVWVYWWGS